ncbi:TPA: hypothetical protein N3Z33_002423 [Klebsiella aerogenes]|nr:hypothetical protein [Klebsiella aerogenes]
MSDEIETIDKNPQSWVAWKREAERLQGIIDGIALAAMDSEPVADDGIFRPGDAVGVFNVGCETCPDHLVAWTVKGQNLPAGNYWLYISQQPAPVVPEDARQALRKMVDEIIAELDAEESACRAAMLQAEPVTKANKLGNSPVIPDGYVIVPKEPTDEMQSAGASAIRIETTALNKLWTGNAVFRAMLAAAPQEVRP